MELILLTVCLMLSVAVMSLIASNRRLSKDLERENSYNKNVRRNGMNVLAKMVANGAVKAGKLPCMSDDGSIYAIGSNYCVHEFQVAVAKHLAEKEARKKIGKALGKAEK